MLCRWHQNHEIIVACIEFIFFGLRFLKLFLIACFFVNHVRIELFLNVCLDVAFLLSFLTCKLLFVGGWWYRMGFMDVRAFVPIVLP